MVAKSNRTTIIVRPDIRDGLKHIARKDQSYNELLADLIKLHTVHVLEIKQSDLDAPIPQSRAQANTINGGEHT